MRVVGWVRYGRPRELCPGNFIHSLPFGLDLQAHYGYGRHAAVATRQTLAHLAGIRHYKGDSQEDPEVGNTRHFDSPIDGGLNFFKNDPLVAQPGTKFNYSTHGFTVAGCAIEGASGQKYVDFVRDNVLLAAGMTHTRPDDRFAVIPYRTRFYSKLKSG